MVDAKDEAPDAGRVDGEAARDVVVGRPREAEALGVADGGEAAEDPKANGAVLSRPICVTNAESKPTQSIAAASPTTEAPRRCL